MSFSIGYSAGRKIERERYEQVDGKVKCTAD
jgi:hypothetical protein